MSGNKPISPLENRSGTDHLSEDRLLAYIEGRLSAEEQHDVERWLADEGMESDAQEGLKALNAGERKGSIDKANSLLRRRIARMKRRRKGLSSDMYVMVAIVFILLVIAAAFLVIKYAS